MRIIGVTPGVERVEWQYLLPTQREDEILKWLAQNDDEDAQWVALDDAEWQFRKHRDRLVPGSWYMGLDEDAEARLRAALRRFIL